MTRRHFLQSIAGSAAGLDIWRTHKSGAGGRSAGDVIVGRNSPPSVVAGVPLPNSDLAHAAVTLASSAYPPYLFNHAMRTYIFGSVVGQAQGHRFDKETLYLACLLHDLGLTVRFEGDLPFEIQGAEVARQFLSDQGVAPQQIEVIWDGIALHLSAVSRFKRAEVALVGAGAAADVLGPKPSEIAQEKISETLKVFPRLRFKEEFLRSCVDVIRRHPAGATRSFMRDIGERLVRDFHPTNFCDLLNRAPFPE